MWTFESVKRNSAVKWVLKAAGLIIIGALGSGFWESALKPALVRTSYGILSVSSLGIESVRTGIYERVATGSTNGASLQSIYLLTLFGTIAYGMAFQRVFFYVRQDRRELARIAQRVAERRKENKPETETVEQILVALRGQVRSGRRVLYIGGAAILLFIGMLLVDLSRINFETAAVVHFQQALKIASPYLTDANRAMVESKFAQIHSKSEYVAIMDGLSKTAKEHGQQVPPFNAW